MPGRLCVLNKGMAWLSERIEHPDYIYMILNYEHYSQRNNENDPFNSCNVTAMVCALAILNIQFPSWKHQQPEDNLEQFLRENGLDKTNHYDLSAGVNKWIDKKITTFTTRRNISDMIIDLNKGLPTVISGTFPTNTKPLGHIVTLVGYDDNGFYISDPYGKYNNGAWSGSGKNCLYNTADFYKIFKSCGDTVYKWGHYFTV